MALKGLLTACAGPRRSARRSECKLRGAGALAGQQVHLGPAACSMLPAMRFLAANKTKNAFLYSVKCGEQRPGYSIETFLGTDHHRVINLKYSCSVWACRCLLWDGGACFRALFAARLGPVVCEFTRRVHHGERGGVLGVPCTSHHQRSCRQGELWQPLRLNLPVQGSIGTPLPWQVAHSHLFRSRAG